MAYRVTTDTRDCCCAVNKKSCTFKIRLKAPVIQNRTEGFIHTSIGHPMKYATPRQYAMVASCINH